MRALLFLAGVIALVVGDCIPGYLATRNGRCVFNGHLRMHSIQAWQVCVYVANGQLVLPKSYEENDYYQSLLNRRNMEGAWLDLWYCGGMWVRGGYCRSIYEVRFTNWDTNEPIYNTPRAFAYMAPNGRWRTSPYNTTIEKDLFCQNDPYYNPHWDIPNLDIKSYNPATHRLCAFEEVDSNNQNSFITGNAFEENGTIVKSTTAVENVPRKVTLVTSQTSPVSVRYEEDRPVAHVDEHKAEEPLRKVTVVTSQTAPIQVHYSVEQQRAPPARSNVQGWSDESSSEEEVHNIVSTTIQPASTTTYPRVDLIAAAPVREEHIVAAPSPVEVKERIVYVKVPEIREKIVYVTVPPPPTTAAEDEDSEEQERLEKAKASASFAVSTNQQAVPRVVVTSPVEEVAKVVHTVASETIPDREQTVSTNVLVKPETIERRIITESVQGAAPVEQHVVYTVEKATTESPGFLDQVVKTVKEAVGITTTEAPLVLHRDVVVISGNPDHVVSAVDGDSAASSGTDIVTKTIAVPSYDIHLNAAGDAVHNSHVITKVITTKSTTGNNEDLRVSPEGSTSGIVVKNFQLPEGSIVEKHSVITLPANGSSETVIHNLSTGSGTLSVPMVMEAVAREIGITSPIESRDGFVDVSASVPKESFIDKVVNFAQDHIVNITKFV